MSPTRKNAAKTGYNLARDAAAFAAALWAALCVMSQPAGTTPAARVTACCSRSAVVPQTAQAEIPPERP